MAVGEGDIDGVIADRSHHGNGNAVEGIGKNTVNPRTGTVGTFTSRTQTAGSQANRLASCHRQIEKIQLIADSDMRRRGNRLRQQTGHWRSPIAELNHRSTVSDSNLLPQKSFSQDDNTAGNSLLVIIALSEHGRDIDDSRGKRDHERIQ
jgi:hypothetical protein